MPNPLDLLRIPSLGAHQRATPLVMGIVNVTPDSFSDGGQHDTQQAALKHALELVNDGADILDIGGESTRPGAQPVSAADEAARVVPLVAALRKHGVQTPVSVDTTKAEVARQALDAGANIINDVSAATADPGMLGLCAATGATLILMHMQGTPRDMQQNPHYDDVVAEVRDYLKARLKAALGAGCQPGALWIDPGFGFGKLAEHNCELVRRLPELAALGHPLVLGASRKSTLGKLTGRPVEDREPESLAAGLVGAIKGASILRVHQVGWMKRALTIAKAML